MKSFFVLMLAGVMALALAACGNSDPTEPESESKADMSAAQNAEVEQSAPGQRNCAKRNTGRRN